LYSGGYYIEPINGFIMRLPNESLKQQLSYKGRDMPHTIFEQLSTAAIMYYHFDSNIETKKKAINILADILENEHDKLIFGIVNGFNIRHNRADQKSDYSKEIWYDWMMQYYTSVIIAFYKLKAKNEFDKFQ
jgi:hypothetical protein